MRSRCAFTSLLIILLGVAFAAPAFSADETRFKINKVTIDGNAAFSDSRLHKVMLSRPSSIFHRYWYYRSILDEDIRQLTRFYHNNGYLEAYFERPVVSIDSTSREVNIQLTVHEGELTRIEGISFFGNTLLPEERLLKEIGIKPGDALIRRRTDDATVAILRLYADRGYLEAAVEPDVRVDSTLHLALIDFTLQENRQFRIGDIRVEGFEITRENVIRRELRFKSEEVVVYSRLLETQRTLYLTGLFQSVFIRPVEPANGDSTLKDVLVEVREALPKEFSVSAGYGSLDRLRGKLEVFNTNLAGTAMKIGVSTRISLIQRSLEGQFTDPWTFNTRWRSDLNLSTEYRQEPGYEIYRNGGRLTAGHQFLKKSRVTFTYRHETAKLRNVRVAEIPERIDTRIRSFRPSILFDTRDNLFNPRRGLFAEWSNELAGAYGGGSSMFVRSELTVRGYVPWGEETVFASSIELGWMDATSGGLSAIPLNERFYAGGPNTVRGFGYQLLGPLDINRNPMGGRVKLIVNALEVRRTIYRYVGAAAFLDLGNVWANTSQFEAEDIRYTPGVGIRVDSPIGLARVDLGFNVEPRPGEDRFRVYFSIGQAF